MPFGTVLSRLKRVWPSCACHHCGKVPATTFHNGEEFIALARVGNVYACRTHYNLLKRNSRVEDSNSVVAGTKSQRTITKPQGTITKPQGTITEPQGTITKPQGTITEPQKVDTKPQKQTVASLLALASENNLTEALYHALRAQFEPADEGRRASPDVQDPLKEPVTIDDDDFTPSSDELNARQAWLEKVAAVKSRMIPQPQWSEDPYYGIIFDMDGEPRPMRHLLPKTDPDYRAEMSESDRDKYIMENF